MNSQTTKTIIKKITHAIKNLSFYELIGSCEEITDVSWGDRQKIQRPLFLARKSLRAGDVSSAGKHLRNAVEVERLLSVPRKKFFKPEITLCCKLYADVYPAIAEDAKPRVI